MIVCECLGLSDRDIRDSIQKGACRLSQIVPVDALNASCGACFDLIKAMVNQGPSGESRPEEAAQPPPQEFPSLSP